MRTRPSVAIRYESWTAAVKPTGEALNPVSGDTEGVEVLKSVSLCVCDNAACDSLYITYVALQAEMKPRNCVVC